MQVLINPNPQLRKNSAEVSKAEVLSSEMKRFVEELKKTMTEEKGVGIAAPQVGVHKRIIIIDTGNGLHAFFNPVVVRRSFWKMENEEGCLSVPGVFGIVRRSRAITVLALNEHAEPITISANKFPATVFQHEIDHLNGILFIDKVIRFTSHPKI